MFQRNSRWHKINDRKWVVKVGFHILKETNVNVYVLKRNNTKKIHSHSGIWKNESILILLKESRRRERGQHDMCPYARTTLQAILSLSPYSYQLFWGSSRGWGDLWQLRVLLLFTTQLLQEILSKAWLPSGKGWWKFGGRKRTRKVIWFHDHLHKQSNKLDEKNEILFGGLANWQLFRKKHINT